MGRAVALSSLLAMSLMTVACHQFPTPKLTNDLERQGQKIFRDDTFGDEQFWTDSAGLNKVVEHQVPPLKALALGLKVDLGRLNIVDPVTMIE